MANRDDLPANVRANLNREPGFRHDDPRNYSGPHVQPQTAPPSLDEDAREDARVIEHLGAEVAADAWRDRAERAEAGLIERTRERDEARTALLEAERRLAEAETNEEYFREQRAEVTEWLREESHRAEQAEAELRTAQADLEAARAEADTHYGAMVDAKAELRELEAKLAKGEAAVTRLIDASEQRELELNARVGELLADRDRLIEAVREARAALNFGATKSGHREAWKILDRASDDGGKR
jgi:chromosome segregation ATPase